MEEASWSKPSRVVIQSFRPAGELIFRHAFFVTNHGESFFPQAMAYLCQQRSMMENLIKEVKEGFGFDQMKSNNFPGQFHSHDDQSACKGIQMGTIRTRLIKVASKLAKPDRYLHKKISSHLVYARFF